MIKRIAIAIFVTLSLSILATSVTYAENVTGRIEHKKLFPLSVGVDGVVDGISVKEGERVLAGTVLLSLNAASFDASISVADAQLSLAREELNEARRSFDRDQALYDEGSLSTVELDLARIEMLRQEMRVAVANAELVKAKSRKAMSQIVAPEAGLVQEFNVAKDQRISMSALQQPMLVFATSALKVVAQIELGEKELPAISSKVSLSSGRASGTGIVQSVIAGDSEMLISISIEENQSSFVPGTAVTIDF